MKLSRGVEQFVDRKRAHGLAYERPSECLDQFRRHVGDLPLSKVRTRHVLTFLDGPQTSTVTWRSKYSLLRGFFEYWASRGEELALRMPQPKPPVRRTFVPHIYTREDIRKLLGAIREYHAKPAFTIDPQTMRTLVLLLYGTGALVGEILKLLPEDVDLRAGFIMIRSYRFNRTRRIPIGHDLRGILKHYVDWKRRRKSIGNKRLRQNRGRKLYWQRFTSLQGR
jgi:integrase/recombinase XerD